MQFSLADTGMLLQVQRVLRHSPLCQIVRRGAEYLFDGEQAAPHQARRWVVGDVHNQIEVSVDQIGVAVTQHQLDVHLGIQPEKIRYQWMDDEATDCLGGADAHQSLGLMGILRPHVQHGLGCAHHIAAAFVDLFSAFAQAKLPRIALQQLHRQAFLQP
ncbi:hypothetical protein D3C78_1458870 [compost metagenome]